MQWTAWSGVGEVGSTRCPSGRESRPEDLGARRQRQRVEARKFRGWCSRWPRCAGRGLLDEQVESGWTPGTPSGAAKTHWRIGGCGDCGGEQYAVVDRRVADREDGEPAVGHRRFDQPCGAGCASRIGRQEEIPDAEPPKRRSGRPVTFAEETLPRGRCTRRHPSPTPRRRCRRDGGPSTAPAAMVITSWRWTPSLGG